MKNVFIENISMIKNFNTKLEILVNNTDYKENKSCSFSYLSSKCHQSICNLRKHFYCFFIFTKLEKETKEKILIENQ